MTKRREIQVNDLGRYEKSSDRLVLEEYSSCEVPAGCGGAVMRWIDPQEALPLHLWLFKLGEAELFFDGAPLRSSRVEARPGKHVLALSMRPAGEARALLALALRYSDERGSSLEEPKRSRSIGRKIAILSGAGARIVGSSVEPEGERWRSVDFDDGPWRALTQKAVKTALSERDWHLSQVLKTGAFVVALPKSAGPIWVRCTFDIDLGGAT